MYKRQVILLFVVFAVTFFSGVQVGPAIGAGPVVGHGSVLQNACPVAVSYTHLDVYKRQAVGRA